MPAITIEYTRGELSAVQLQQEVATFFDALEAGDPAIEQDALAAGVTPAALAAAGPAAFRFEGRRPGLTGVEEAILLLMLDKAFDIAWEQVVRPWINRRRGRGAVGEETGRTSGGE